MRPRHRFLPGVDALEARRVPSTLGAHHAALPAHHAKPPAHVNKHHAHAVVGPVGSTAADLLLFGAGSLLSGNVPGVNTLVSVHNRNSVVQLGTFGAGLGFGPVQSLNVFSPIGVNSSLLYNSSNVSNGPVAGGIGVGLVPGGTLNGLVIGAGQSTSAPFSSVPGGTLNGLVIF